MQKRHEDALMQRLETVACSGFTFILWWELYLWYGMERLSKAVWRDLRSRFTESVSEEDDVELWVRENTIGILLVRSNDLVKISDKLGEND